MNPDSQATLRLPRWTADLAAQLDQAQTSTGAGLFLLEHTAHVMDALGVAQLLFQAASMHARELIQLGMDPTVAHEHARTIIEKWAAILVPPKDFRLQVASELSSMMANATPS